MPQVRPSIKAAYEDVWAKLEQRVAARIAVPRCCDTHANLALQELFPENPELTQLCEIYRQNSQGDVWAVLVAGETQSAMQPDKKKSREGKYLAGHCSLENIGHTYEKLVAFVPPERIIVIAQLQETIDWLREAIAAPDDRFAAMSGNLHLRDTFSRRLANTLAACRVLLGNGGADYDGTLVNPSTVVKVLTGEEVVRGKKVVPQHGCGKLFLVLNSHGNSYTTLPVPERAPDAPKPPPRVPEPMHEEWYFHMPYPAPDTDLTLYDFAAHECYTANMKADDVPRTHRCLLYSQMMVYAMHTMLQRAPHRQIFPLYQFCLSGGFARFLDLPSNHRYFGSHKWPIFMVVTSGQFESALGSFLGTVIGQIADALKSGGQQSLAALYENCAAIYWKENASIREMNADVRATVTPALLAETQTLGSVNCHCHLQSLADTSLVHFFS